MVVDKAYRKRVLELTSWVSILGNGLLSLLKITVGIVSGSIAVLSDGIDSASDVLISLITLFTAKIIVKPPSTTYVYGYEKADMIATKLLSFIMFFAGFQILVESIKKMVLGTTANFPGTLAIYVTLFSIVGKFLLSIYQTKQGKKVDSPMLIANAKNMRNDILISVGVLVGLVLTFVLHWPFLDALVGLIISLFILKSAFSIFMEANITLMDGIKDLSMYEKVFASVEKVPGVKNPHRVRVRQIGSLYTVVLDIEVDGNLSLMEAHQITHQVEKSIKNDLDNIYDIVVHVEPEGCTHEKERFGLDKDMLS